MKLFYTLLVLLLSCTYTLHAQYNIPENNIWAMGFRAGVNFNTTPPSAIATAMYTAEGCASVSNGEFGLQFYTNGKIVWNAFNNIMPNGSDILGAGHTTASTTQAAVIVPAPGSDRYYYLFSLTDNTATLFCNRVDMSLAGGLGDIDTGFPLRHIALKGALSEKMVAAPGCNNNVWLLVFGADGKAYAYEITTAGVNLTPVVSSFGEVKPNGTGSVRVSPKADRIVAGRTQVGAATMTALFNFDYTNGTLTLNRIIDSASYAYGCAFSPDGTKLYSYNQQLDILQYNLDDPYPAATAITLGEGMNFDLKLAVDGKIYFISSYGSGQFLGCIEHPDALGIAAGFRDTVINLSPGLSPLCLPNDVVLAGNIPPGGINRVVMDTVVCGMPSAGVKLIAAPASGGYIWDNNSTADMRTVTQTGTYFVQYNTVCGTRVDTFKVKDGSVHTTLQFSNPVLRTGDGYAHYWWYKGNTLLAGATGHELTVTSNGWYSVVVQSQWGCRDSVSIQVTGYVAIDPVEQLSRSITVHPNPASDHVYIKAPVAISYRLYGADGRVYLQGKENAVNIANLAPGLYFLQVCDQKGNRIKTEKVLKL
ncbi:T9SS type A sorting domain-containing protein [Taibaiella koreensis]|uniref:T9SS type A sorting domain-containing protein n=1 Tax=Taibaiella koreensis TaxID=1268548 RepID=UPI000E599FE9|nr:T9SS type A sorting domain-containing protein [Taibaiella koreensis]